MKTKFYLAAAAVFYVTVICSAYADNDTSSIENAKIGMAQAITTAEQFVGGKAVHAEYEHHKNQTTFDVEIVKDKKIMKVKIDPTSGKVLSSTEDKDDEHKKHDKHHNGCKDDKVD